MAKSNNRTRGMVPRGINSRGRLYSNGGKITKRKGSKKSK